MISAYVPQGIILFLLTILCNANSGGKDTTQLCLGATDTCVTTVWRNNVLPFFSVCWVQQGQEIFSELNKSVPSHAMSNVSVAYAYKGFQAALFV